MFVPTTWCGMQISIVNPGYVPGCQSIFRQLGWRQQEVESTDVISCFINRPLPQDLPHKNLPVSRKTPSSPECVQKFSRFLRWNPINEVTLVRVTLMAHNTTPGKCHVLIKPVSACRRCQFALIVSFLLIVGRKWTQVLQGARRGLGVSKQLRIRRVIEPRRPGTDFQMDQQVP